jgi:hypothetical protein
VPVAEFVARRYWSRTVDSGKSPPWIAKTSRTDGILDSCDDTRAVEARAPTSLFDGGDVGRLDEVEARFVGGHDRRAEVADGDA